MEACIDTIVEDSIKNPTEGELGVYKYPMSFLHTLLPTKNMYDSYREAVKDSKVQHSWKKAVGYVPALGLAGLSTLEIRILAALPILMANNREWKAYSAKLSQENARVKNFSGHSGHTLSVPEGVTITISELYDALYYPKYTNTTREYRSSGVTGHLIKVLQSLASKLCFLPISKNSLAALATEHPIAKFIDLKRTDLPHSHFYKEVAKVQAKTMDSEECTSDAPTGVVAAHTILLYDLTDHAHCTRQFRIFLNPLLFCLSHYTYLSATATKYMLQAYQASILPLKLMAFLCRYPNKHFMSQYPAHFLKMNLGLLLESQVQEFALAETTDLFSNTRLVIRGDVERRIIKEFAVRKTRDIAYLNRILGMLKQQGIIIDYLLTKDVLEIYKNDKHFLKEMPIKLRQQIFAKQRNHKYNTLLKQKAKNIELETKAADALTKEKREKAILAKQQAIELLNKKKREAEYRTYFNKGIFVEDSPMAIKKEYLEKYGFPLSLNWFTELYGEKGSKKRQALGRGAPEVEWTGYWKGQKKGLATRVEELQ